MQAAPNEAFDDPFAPPVAALGPGHRSRPDDFFDVFWRWEKYRLAYNAILLAETLLGLLGRQSLLRPDFLALLVLYAAIANVCFCAGPVLNGYAWRLGFRERWVGLGIVVAGTLFAMLMAALVLMTLSPSGTFLLD